MSVNAVSSTSGPTPVALATLPPAAHRTKRSSTSALVQLAQLAPKPAAGAPGAPAAAPVAGLPSGEERIAADLHRQVLLSMHQQYPDVRHAAKMAIEKRLKDQYKLELDADHTYYNEFPGSIQSNDLPLDTPQEFRRKPSRSTSLTDMQWQVATGSRPQVRANDIISDAGVYTEGIWAGDFGPQNQVPLTAAQLLLAAQQNQFFASYEEQLAQYWRASFDTLQTLAEIKAFDYVEQHRRAGNRGRALGIDGELELSDEALAMVAEATGRRDPDFAKLGTRVFRFDINGYVSRDMLWLRDKSQRVVLVMPGATYPLREFRNLGHMREAIRDMTRTEQGRKTLASHFNGNDRPTHWYSSYDGVDKWLRTINDDHDGTYDYAIARYEMPMHDPMELGRADAVGAALLSDKAVTMLNEAAGATILPPWQAQHTVAFRFDINGMPSVDIIWLRAADGHVVLLLPDDARPVREYANVAAMRTDILSMLASTTGRQALARHFMPDDRRSDQNGTRPGVDQWLFDINGNHARYQGRIASTPEIFRIGGNGGNVFRDQQLHIRQWQLKLATMLRLQQWKSLAERNRWIDALSLPQQDFYGTRPVSSICEIESNGIAQGVSPLPRPSRMRRAPGQQGDDHCLSNRPHASNWAVGLTNRLRSAARDSLVGRADDIWAAAAGAGSVAASPVLARPLVLPRGRVTNGQGFLETSRLPILYIAWPVRNVRELSQSWAQGGNRHDTPMPRQADRNLPEINGFIPQQGFCAGRRALDGELIDTWITPEAAREAAVARYGEEGRRATMYTISPTGLTGVSFSDNRIHNPDYARLMGLTGNAQSNLVQAGEIQVSYPRSRFAALSDLMVQLRMDGKMAQRTSRELD